MESLKGKKLVVALSCTKLWNSTYTKSADLDRTIIGDTIVFTSERSGIDQRFTDYDEAKSIHLFPMAYGISLTGVFERLAPNVQKFVHTDDRDDVMPGWEWGECVDHHGIKSDLACLLSELPLSNEQKEMVRAMQQQAFAGMINP